MVEYDARLSGYQAPQRDCTKPHWCLTECPFFLDHYNVCGCGSRHSCRRGYLYAHHIGLAMPYKAFVSSTFEDLKDHRHHVITCGPQ